MKLFFFSGSLCSFLPHSFCFNAFSSIRMLLSRLSQTEMNNLCMSRLYSICVRKKKESFVWVLNVLRLIIEFFGDFSLHCIFYGTTKRTESFLSFFFHHRFSWFSIQCRQTNTNNGKLHLYMNNCTRKKYNKKLSKNAGIKTFLFPSRFLFLLLVVGHVPLIT